MAVLLDNGMVHFRSHHSVEATLQRLKTVLHRHGPTIFCAWTPAAKLKRSANTA
jgi:uncharacterized protein (DUF302 family)